MIYDPDNKINTAAEKQKKDTRLLSDSAVCLHNERYRIQVSKAKELLPRGGELNMGHVS